MNITRHIQPWGARGVALLACCRFGQLAAADFMTILPPLHQLRGIKSIRVSVVGLSAGLGKSSVTDEALRASVLARLKRAGIRVAGDDVLGVPALAISVLPVERGSEYFLTIQVDLREPCTVPRDPQMSGAMWVTWSTGPQPGIVSKGAESRIELLVAAAVDRFVKAWQSDNPKAPGSEKHPNTASLRQPAPPGAWVR
jgi:hypothetical protein